MKLFRREKYISRIRPFLNDTDIIKVITGIRRSGKSSLLQTVAEELMESGVSEKNTRRDLIQKRNGIKHVDIIDFILKQRMFD